MRILATQKFGQCQLSFYFSEVNLGGKLPQVVPTVQIFVSRRQVSMEVDLAKPFGQQCSATPGGHITQQTTKGVQKGPIGDTGVPHLKENAPP